MTIKVFAFVDDAFDVVFKQEDKAHVTAVIAIRRTFISALDPLIVNQWPAQT